MYYLTLCWYTIIQYWFCNYCLFSLVYSLKVNKDVKAHFHKWMYLSRCLIWLETKKLVPLLNGDMEAGASPEWRRGSRWWAPDSWGWWNSGVVLTERRSRRYEICGWSSSAVPSTAERSRTQRQTCRQTLRKLFSYKLFLALY